MPAQTKTVERNRQRAASAASVPPCMLFTAFEPSGDRHAAPVIASLREILPDTPIYAWGGPHMAGAGATIIEHTCEDGSMGLGAVGKALVMQRHMRSIKRWCQQVRLGVHVAVDSPAANFPICRITRRVGARIVHLVAPQLWAWGGWRIGKLRRRTDLVLCLLPFEEEWFRSRNVPARFIGHWSMNRELDEKALREIVVDLPHGSPKLAIFPGSRTHEVRANIRLMAAVFEQLQNRRSGITGLIVAANDQAAGIVRKRVGVFPNGLNMIVGKSDAAVSWCDLALTVSGTMTLDIARQCKPMVGVYRTGPISYLGSKVLLRTRYRLLPNIIAGREICPEFVPWAGGSEPVMKAVYEMIEDSKNMAQQQEELRRLNLRFSNKRPGPEAARLIDQLIKEGAISA